jgi:hypothetical protein
MERFHIEMRTGDSATSATLASFVSEIAIKLGCSPERFARLSQQRQDYWTQYFLQQVENVSSDLAAQVDRRGDEIGSDVETYEPLFPESKE